jgi:cadmium resistance protein CadD (predicted permease)
MVLLSTIGIAIVVFVATNVDDIFLLAALFADRSIQRRAVVVGQFVGIGALVAMSWIAARLALAIPAGWVALLGLAPLLLGILGFVSLLRRAPPDDDADEAAESRGRVSKRLWHSQVLAVTAITVANGGDNLGVYIPLFASNPAAVPIHIAAFTVLTGLWCVLGYYLVHNPLVGDAVRRHAHVVLPFVLIALGLYILSDAWVLFG